jgi:hypothetical protein
VRRLLLVVWTVLQSPLAQAFGYTAGGGVVGAWAGVQVYELVLEVAAAMPAPTPTYGPTPLPSRTPNGGSDANARFPIPVTPVARV